MTLGRVAAPVAAVREATADRVRARKVRPHVREFLADTLTPLAVYRRLAALSPVRFLLESVTGGEQVSRYSASSAPAPRELLRLSRPPRASSAAAAAERLPGAPLAALRAALDAFAAPPGRCRSPAAGWASSATTWCACSSACRRPRRRIRTAAGRRARPLRHRGGVRPRAPARAGDRQRDRGRGRPRAPAEAGARPSSTAAAHRRRRRRRRRAAGGRRAAPRRCRRRASSATASRPRCARAKEHIAAGDIFQVVLARRLRCRRPPRRWRSTARCGWSTPARTWCCSELPDGGAGRRVAGDAGAQERRRRRRRGPIAGTRRRGADAEERPPRSPTSCSPTPKERAEHVMLVDLGRNDLGRVARAGERARRELHGGRALQPRHAPGVERGGRAAPTGSDGARRAAAPASRPARVSGAPKIRAMEIIDELEPEAARALRRRGRLPLVRAATSTPASPSAPWWCADGEVVGHRRRRHRRRLRSRRPKSARPRTRRRRCSQRWRSPKSWRGDRERCPPSERRLILVVDNYDSFTYNLVQLLLMAGAEVEVLRNDAEPASAMLARRPDGIVLSPGPGRPEDAGVCVELLGGAAGAAGPRRLPRPPGAGRRLRRHGRAAPRPDARQDLAACATTARASSPACPTRSRPRATTASRCEAETLPAELEAWRGRRRHAHGDAPPRAAVLGRAVPSRVGADRSRARGCWRTSWRSARRGAER